MPIRLERFANRHYAAACALWEGTHGVDLGGADSEESIAQFHACNPGTTYVALDEAKLVATILVGHVCSSSKSASGSAKALYLMRLVRVFSTLSTTRLSNRLCGQYGVYEARNSIRRCARPEQRPKSDCDSCVRQARLYS
jgi:hypothetical protein